MHYGALADGVVLLHLAFIVFVIVGGFLAWRWPRIVWLHLPALVWAAYIEAAGAICPLTPLEKLLRQMAGESSYSGGFINHYLIPLIYPPGLTRQLQWSLMTALVVINALAYGVLLQRARRGRSHARR
jgi:hypothetical protein